MMPTLCASAKAIKVCYYSINLDAKSVTLFHDLALGEWCIDQAMEVSGVTRQKLCTLMSSPIQLSTMELGNR